MMNPNKKTILTLLVFCLTISFTLQAQTTLKTPANSPTQTLKQNFGLSEITIEYSRPSVKGRVIFGEVVPFGAIWRTGANAATKFTFGEDVSVQGKPLPAGTYALYTLPNKDSWDIIFYKDLTLGGNTSNYKPENEVIRFTVKPSKIVEKVETFSINLNNVQPTKTSIELIWENTKVSFEVVVDIDSKIMAAIDASLAADSRPYFQAASYYYDNNKDLVKALEWANKAVEQNPKAYWVLLLKARIQLKSNDQKGAITTAEQVIAIGKETKNEGVVKMGEAFIAESKKQK